MYWEEYKEAEVLLYTGNVVSEGKVKIDDVEKMIEEERLLKYNPFFKKYIIIGIENKTVRENGYYEYLIIPLQVFHSSKKEHLPYYLITDGKRINFAKQMAMNYRFPSNANIITDEVGNKELVLCYPDSLHVYAAYEYIGCAEWYKLEGEKFVLNELKEREELSEYSLMYIYEDGELNRYKLKIKENFCVTTMSLRDRWIIDRKY